MKDIDIAEIDDEALLTMRRIRSALNAMNSSKSDWAEEYWSDVVQALIDSYPNYGSGK